MSAHYQQNWGLQTLSMSLQSLNSNMEKERLDRQWKTCGSVEQPQTSKRDTYKLKNSRKIHQQTIQLQKKILKNKTCASHQMHGKRILKLLQKIFSWLPLVTVIDQKVLVLHGGISDTTDLSVLARVDRHNVGTSRVKQSCAYFSFHVISVNYLLLSVFRSMFQRSGLQRRDTRAQRGRPSTRMWMRTSGPPTDSSSAGPPSHMPNLWELATASRTARCRTSQTGLKWTWRTSWRAARGDSPFSTRRSINQKKRWLRLCPLTVSSAMTTPRMSGNRWAHSLR